MSNFVKDCPAFIAEDLADDLDAIFQRLRVVCPFASLDDSSQDKFMCKLYHISSLAKIFKSTVNEFLKDYGKERNAN